MVDTNIFHREVRDSRTEAYENGRWSVSRHFNQIPYKDRFGFFAALIGGIDNNDGVISLVSPDQDNWIPGLFCTKLQNIRGEPLAKPDPKGITFDKCQVTAVYESPPDSGGSAEEEDDPQLFQSISIDASPISIDIAGTNFRFEETTFAEFEGGAVILNPDFVNERIPRLMGSMTVTIDRKFVPTLPLDLYQQKLGKVNKEVFEGLEVGKVLFHSIRARRSFYFTTQGQVAGAFDVTLGFTWREEFWNAAPHPFVNGDFVKLIPPPYKETTFDELLQFGLAPGSP